MSVLTSAPRFRRTASGVALIVSPVLFSAAEMLAPEQQDDNAKQLAVYATHRSALLVSSFLSITVALVLMVGTVGLVHLVRARGVTYANLAAVFVAYGLVFAHAALGGVNLMFAEMVKPGLDRTAMLSLYDSLMHDVTLAAPLLLGHYIFVVGLILLAVALLRAQTGPRWAAVCVLLFPVSDVILGNFPLTHLAEIVSGAFAVAGFAGLGVYLLRMSDAQWETVAVDQVTARSTDPVPA